MGEVVLLMHRGVMGERIGWASMQGSLHGCLGWGGVAMSGWVGGWVGGGEGEGG